MRQNVIEIFSIIGTAQQKRIKSIEFS